jgi:cyclopropane-fatty-acyl-phospholipid synthase
MLATTGITINGNSPWDLHVRDDRTFSRLLQNKSLGLGESYMEGWWDCRQLDEFVCKLLTAGLDRKDKDSFKFLVPVLSAMLFNMQSKIRSRIVAEQHYDLDNELFMSFLDPYNQYSCAYFDGTGNLNEAQLKKMNLICREINLSKDDNVLDIGCGWRGFAKYMAEHYGCRVTAINISEKQISYAREFCNDLPVEILQYDYRYVQGSNEPPRSKLRGISRLVAALKTKQASGNITRRDSSACGIIICCPLAGAFRARNIQIWQLVLTKHGTPQPSLR